MKANLEAATKQQIKRPWQREGADKPPTDFEARKMNKSMVRGKDAAQRPSFVLGDVTDGAGDPQASC